MVVLSSQYGQSENAKKVTKVKINLPLIYHFPSFPSSPPFHNSLIYSKSNKIKTQTHGQLGFLTHCE